MSLKVKLNLTSYQESLELSSLKYYLFVMEASYSEKQKQAVVNWVLGHQLKAEAFVTLSTRVRNEANFLKKIKRMLLKSSYYSKSHIAAVGGYERSIDHIHGHLVILTEGEEKRLKDGFLSNRWSVGTWHTSSLYSSDKDSLKRACFYALNHPEQLSFADFCPYPKKCASEWCLHRKKRPLPFLDRT